MANKAYSLRGRGLYAFFVLFCAGCIGKTEQMFGYPLFSNPERAPLARLRGAGGSVERSF